MKKTVFLSALVGAVSALLVGGTVAVATNMTFVLGAANTPDALTTVTAKNKDGHGGLSGPMIQLTNSSTGGSATPLRLAAGSGRPPFTTNSSTRVANLNADTVDGLDAGSFVQGAGGRLSTASAFLTPGTYGQVVLDQSHGRPPFNVIYDCDDSLNDPSFYFGNSSTSAYASVVIIDASTPFATRSTGVAPGQTVGVHHSPFADNITFNASWTDGHMATIWGFAYLLDNQPDPRDNGCYVQVMALAK